MKEKQFPEQFTAHSGRSNEAKIIYFEDIVEW
jgi:hypothetical protein